MTSLLLLAALAAAAFFGFRLMKKLDAFLEENQRRLADAEESPNP